MAAVFRAFFYNEVAANYFFLVKHSTATDQIFINITSFRI